MSIAGIRIQNSDLPEGRSVCPMPGACVYRVDGICDEPRTNKRNSDAGCHRMTNKHVLRVLIPLHK